MKKLIFVLALLPAAVYGQCDFAVNKTDDFTNAKVRETELVLLYKDMVSGASKGFYIGQVNSAYYVKMRSSFAGTAVVGHDGELMFKLANDSVVSLKAMDIYAADVSGTLSVLNAKYSITKEQLELLSKFGIKKFRYTTSDGYAEEDVKEKWQVRLMEPAGCILK
jgi:hypothetical protein